MRKILLIALMPVLLLACKKNKEDMVAPASTDPTLTKKGNNFTVTPPKNGVELTYTIQSGSYDVGTTNLSFDWDGTATITNFANFVCEVVRDSDSVRVFNSAFIMQKNGMLSLGSIIKKETKYTLKLKFNTTSGQNGKTFNLLVRMHSDQSYQTGLVASSVITFGLPSMMISSDPNIPATARVLGGTEVHLTTAKFEVNGQDVKPNAIVVNLNNSSAISGVYIYDSLGGLLGSANTFSSGVATVSVNYTQAEGTGSYVVKAQLKAVTSAAGSNVGVSASVSEVRFKTLDGTDKLSTGSATGNDMYVFKTISTITTNSISGNIVNGVPMVVNSTTVATTGGSGSDKTLSWEVLLVDNGFFKDTLKGVLAIKENGSLMDPSTYKFTKPSGAIVDTITSLDTKISVTFLTEVTGTNIKYELVITPLGYNHQDGNVLATKFLLDGNRTSYQYLNSGIGPDNIVAKLFNSPAASSGAIKANYITSDRSAGLAHSYGFGASTADWTNGYSIKNNISQQVFTY